MLWNAENGNIPFPDTDMDYVRFGTGEKILVMLPGLRDGLRTVKGTALPVALMYRMFAKEYTVYGFSRKNRLPEGYTTRDMAWDQKWAMDALGISRADVLGVSMGGMIAQHLAMNYPESVGRLVLAVTASRPNPVLAESVTEWLSLAEQGDFTALMDSNMRRVYSDAYYRRNRLGIPLVAKLTRPRSYDRFFVQARACLAHDTWEDLPQIQGPTLVIGGEQDRTLGGEASREIAARIPNAELYLYAEYGHGLYEEAKDFNSRVFAFLQDVAF